MAKPAQPAGSAPPNSQFRADTTHMRAKVEDLTTDELNSCDGIIILLGERNLINCHANDDDRKVFWKMVFHNWNTNIPFHKPRLQKRDAASVSIVVGHLKSDCPPPSQGSKRQRNGTYIVPEARRQGAEILMKLHVDFESEEISFKYTDGGHSLVPPRLVQLSPGFTRSQARASLVIHWDNEETVRITSFNNKMATYWARQLLVHRLESAERLQVAGQGPENTASAGRATAALSRDNDPHPTDFVQLVTAHSILKDLAQVAAETDTIVKSNGHQSGDFRHQLYL